MSVIAWMWLAGAAWLLGALMLTVSGDPTLGAASLAFAAFAALTASRITEKVSLLGWLAYGLLAVGTLLFASTLF